MNRKSKPQNKKNFTMYNETLYEVEKVVSVKWIKNHQYCLIKWKGYDENFNTWQPKEHITFCYKETPQEQKDDDDPEYVQNINVPSRSSHNYHTRAKKNNKDKVITIPQDRQDPTQLDEPHSSEHQSQYPKIKRTPEAPNPEQIQLKKSGEKSDCYPIQTQITQRDCLVSKIIGFYSDDNNRKRGQVLLQSGKTAHMDYDAIKKRFPQKLIEYYENNLQRGKD